MPIKTSGLKGLSQKVLMMIKNVRFLQENKVLLGVHKSENKKIDATMNLATLAAIHEEGTDRVPARPFLSITMEERKAETHNVFMTEIISKLYEGGSAERGLNRIALESEAYCRTKVIGNKRKLALLNKSTIKRKKSSAPLIDTGRLRQSIRGVIRKDEHD